jgi:NADP-dependent 3-hydroxy acid dehydrogenase YdfG
VEEVNRHECLQRRLVPGATVGIGKETSLALARAGRAVVVSGRREDAGEAVVREIRDNGVGAVFVDGGYKAP